MPKRLCKTPDTDYQCQIGGDTIRLTVKLPFDLSNIDGEPLAIESELHDAVESILAPVFLKRFVTAPYCPFCGTRKGDNPHTDGCAGR